MPARARITLGAAVALAAVVAVCAYAADSNVPQFTKLSASPTRVHFTITTGAKVIADIRPRKTNVWGRRLFTRRFPAGANTAGIDTSRLKAGRWTIRVQGVNSLGAGPPAVTDIHVK